MPAARDTASGNPVDNKPGRSGWRQRLARAGEEAAARYFAGKGARILARNWRAGRYAEVDLILRQGEVIVFVEVKTRRKVGNGVDSAQSAFDSINRRKQQKIVTSARIYLARHNLAEAPWRLDVVFVEFCLAPDWQQATTFPDPAIIHVAGAFAASG
ncbi:MAG TPA: YraN family protein [Candidatus Obscuribacterales bacterium]